MSAILYDVAVLNKIKGWVKDKQMLITGPNETRRLFEYKADVTNDKPLDLPLITLRRGPEMLITLPRKRPLSFDGFRKDADWADDEETLAKISQLNAIPITLSYQLDIYTRYFEEAEEYVRNFAFNMINFPKFTVEIPYNEAKIHHYGYLILNDTVQDNSDIPERLIAGQFTRKTLAFTVDGYLFDYKVKDAVKIEDVDIDIKVKLQVKE